MAERMIADAFHFADVLSVGLLQPEDYKVAVIFLLGYKPSARETQAVFKSKPALNMDEFHDLMKARLQSREPRDIAREVFTAFDRHCKGFLSIDDGRRVFAEVCERQSV